MIIFLSYSSCPNRKHKNTQKTLATTWQPHRTTKSTVSIIKYNTKQFNNILHNIEVSKFTRIMITFISTLKSVRMYYGPLMIRG